MLQHSCKLLKLYNLSDKVAFEPLLLTFRNLHKLSGRLETLSGH